MHSCNLSSPIFTAASEFEFEETEEGFFVHAFLISNRVNANNWMVTNEANRLDGEDFVGKPDIVFLNDKGIRDHTTGRTLEESMKVQEPFRKGTIRTVKGTDTGIRLSTTSKIDDPDTIAKIKSHEIQFVSPAIFPKSLEDVEIVRTGPNTHIHIVHRYNALHRAFVDDPAYGIEAAVGPTCEGDVKSCMVRLQQIHAGIGDDEVDPLREIKLIKIKTSKCSETGNLIFEMPAGDLNDCVTSILSEKLGPGEEPTDQDLAIAFSECRNKLKKSKAKESKQATTKSNKDDNYSSGIDMPTEDEKDKQIQALKSKAQEVEKELKEAKKANEELTEEKKKETAKKAAEDEEKEKARKGQEETPEEKKKEQAKKAQEEEKKKEDDMTAKIASQLSIKIPLVQKYVAAKTEQKNLDSKAAKELYDKTLSASVEEITAKLDDIGPFVGMQKSNDSPIGYGGESFTASKYDSMSDEELEKQAGVVQ